MDVRGDCFHETFENVKENYSHPAHYDRSDNPGLGDVPPILICDAGDEEPQEIRLLKEDQVHIFRVFER